MTPLERRIVALETAAAETDFQIIAAVECETGLQVELDGVVYRSGPGEQGDAFCRRMSGPRRLVATPEDCLL